MQKLQLQKQFSMLVIEILKLIPKMLIEFKQSMHAFDDIFGYAFPIGECQTWTWIRSLSEKVIFGGAHLGFVIISIAAASSAFSCTRQSFAAGQPHIAYFHIWTNLTTGAGGGRPKKYVF